MYHSSAQKFLGVKEVCYNQNTQVYNITLILVVNTKTFLEILAALMIKLVNGAEE